MVIPSDIEVYVKTSIENVNHRKWSRDYAHGYCLGRVEGAYISDKHIHDYIKYVEDSFEKGVYEWWNL